MMKGKKGNALIIIGVIVGVILLIGIAIALWAIGARNGFVTMEEGVNAKWSNVQTAYQRRADLIPNLVATVKASAEFEKSLQTEVTNARAGIANAKTPAELDQAGSRINTAINVVFENYPEIKSTERYADLQVSLEGTENRIKTERDAYNEAVRAFNTRVRLFPGNIIAGMFGFSEKQYFQSDAGAATAPNVGNLFNS